MIARYHTLAIILHWTIAIAIVFMLLSGLYMVNADITKAAQFKLYQTHKAAGVLCMLAIAGRLLVRLTLAAPALPDNFSVKQRSYAKGGHIALYLVMIVMPVSGWLMVSASPFGLPTMVFDLFEWPHIPGVARNKNIEMIANNVHWYGAIVFVSLISLHLAALVRHRRVDHVNLLPRMWWSKRNDK